MRELTLVHRTIAGETWRVAVSDAAGDRVTLERSSGESEGVTPSVSVLSVPAAVLALAVAMSKDLDP